MGIGVGGLVTTRDGVEKKTADLLNKRRGGGGKQAFLILNLFI